MRITLPGVGERAGGEGVGAPGLPAGGLAGQSSPVLHELKVISSSRISSLRRRLSVMAVKCQASSLLGRLETLGPGGTAALRRRQQAAGIERAWQEENRAQLQATRDGFRGLRSGFAKLD